MQPDPWPELGITIWGGHAGPPPYDFREASYADTTCHVGAFGRSGSILPNHVFMRLSELRPSTRKTVARLGAEAVDEIRARNLEPRGNVRHALLL